MILLYEEMFLYFAGHKKPFMSRKISCLLLMFAFFCCITLHGQSFLGLHTSNFDPLKNVYYNPAILSGSDLRWQLNVLSVDINAGNDYIRVGKLRGVVRDFDRNINFPEILNGQSKNLNLNADIQGPGFMMQIGKNAFAITTRARIVTSVNDVNEGMASSLYNHGKQLLQYVPSFQDDRITAAMHQYTELGLAYSRELLDKGGHRLRAGIHFKFLSPGFYTGFEGNNLSYQRTLHPENDSTVNVGNSTFDLRVSEQLQKGSNGKADFSYPFTISGFGIDAGVEYEFRVTRLKNYFIRAGIAINDMGTMAYQYGNYSRTFTGNGRDIPSSSLLGEDGILRSWDEVLDSLGTQQKSSGKFNVNLPMVLNAYADICVIPKLYLHVGAQFNPYNFEKGNPKANLPSVITLVPRFETNKISAFLPISYDRYGGMSIGGGARIGMIGFGTSNLVSSFMKKDFTAVDFYFSVAFGQKKRINN